MSQLEMRLHREGPVHCVQDDFDGAQPRSSSRHASLSDSDISLMWHLFDYAKVSSQSQGTVMHRADTLQDASEVPMPDTGFENSAYGMIEARDFAQDSIAISTSGSYGAGGHATRCPDWDLTTGVGELDNDWSLLGTPWLGYFPS